ncbi:hypothetical protein [Kaarinaea lacus]
MVSEEHCVVLLLESNDSDANIIIQNFQLVDVPHEVRRVADSEAMLVYLEECVNKSSSENYIKPRLIILGIDEFNDNIVNLLEFIQQNSELKRVPVLVCTSTLNDNDSIIRAYQLKANSYLVKPEDKNEFSNIAREVGSYWLKWNQLPP